jgi:hypothetical protein
MIGRVNPMYYVGFSTATLVASLILFQGFNTTGATNTVSLLAGFLVTFLGVHLLNLSRIPEPIPDAQSGHTALEGGLLNPRLSLQGRMSLDGWNGDAEAGGGEPLRSAGHGRRSSLYRSQNATLFNAFEEERGGESVGLRKLREEDDVDDDDDDDADERTHLRSVTAKRERGRHNDVPRSHSRSPNIPSLGDDRGPSI